MNFPSQIIFLARSGCRMQVFADIKYRTGELQQQNEVLHFNGIYIRLWGSDWSLKGIQSFSINI